MRWLKLQNTYIFLIVMIESNSEEMCKTFQRIRNTDFVQSGGLGKGSWRKWLWCGIVLPISEHTFQHFIIHDLPSFSEFSWWGNYYYLGWLPIISTYNYIIFSVVLWKDNLLVLIFPHLKNSIILTPWNSQPLGSETDSEPVSPASCLEPGQLFIKHHSV